MIRTSKKAISIAVSIVVFVAAMLLTLYPVISNWYNGKHQSKIHTEYQQMIEQAEDTTINGIRELAVAYNKSLVPGTQSAGAYTNESLLQAAESYGSQLNISGNGIMGYISAPSIGVNLPIYHGTEDKTLEIGVGHLLGSSLPVGGESTHTILTGHSGMASQKMFSDLDRLAVGDVFYLDVLGETLAYQVDQIKTVLPYDTSNLGIEQGKDYATLVTCTPFGINTHRLLVRGVRIPYEEAEKLMAETQNTEEVESTWEEEYKQGILTGVTIVAAVILVALIFWLLGHNNNAGN